ncbi:MAG: methylmalonyl-CoA epimerase [Arenicellales bacterium]|jgi:methylmalonyl-CoA/ethylmalonyl-CoA epimerase|nr:methylmalonyl-CoA epimerase [Acidiferrobacteraceae bacterium]MDP6122833.1 methylmalonyl-CoA epimerase [Arenicellales bacterium]MDP6289330.1 methylmalonyl-CoA epimerase [Arenicellales bacterium]MDP6434267.1 methylmalonyl-CoA epimerase [Arenicellales bacterium]MDP6671804.1 methylmalonyl-CoA epimerase [Arenicellales bacterium]|tara:strand:- start:1853 stop:2257 length:405 start_codon:yes stop_codon:yes gene_type:complete
MIGRLNHVAIVVPDLEAASNYYRNIMGAEVSSAEALPEHGVITVFVELENSTIELLHPLGDHSPVSAFLERNPDGGVHHLCYQVEDITSARLQLETSGARVLGDGKPRIGAHGNPVLFLHPKDSFGVLIELEEG